MSNTGVVAPAPYKVCGVRVPRFHPPQRVSSSLRFEKVGTYFLLLQSINFSESGGLKLSKWFHEYQK
jgi:hypothetical protein